MDGETKVATRVPGDGAAELLPRLGSLAQLIACESSVVSDGQAAGSRRIRVTVGELDLELLPDRGLDIGAVRFAGQSMAWISPTGLPARSGDADFARTFGGGLLTTCGLRNFGPAVTDEGESHPMHGRYSGLRASVRRAEADLTGVVVEAEAVEAEVFGAQLRLRRRVEVPYGEAAITVRDTVTNMGPRSESPMVLYHLNFGWPLIDEGTILRSSATAVVPRDEEAERGIDTWSVYPALTSPYPEQVFTHELGPDRGEVSIESRGGLGARVDFDAATLPGLMQWRVAEPGCSVLGIEPASAATILGRADARRRGLLQPLAPGESRDYRVTVSFART